MRKKIEFKPKNLKFAEEDHDFDLCVYPRTHRMRLHCHMDSWIVKCSKIIKLTYVHAIYDLKVIHEREVRA